ncbi:MULTISPECIES: MerR family transcriptional regulator [Peribacillus]|uniref:MerR family transcriptional regulator n=1 Tax=Peribacillus TaxID=2675229 RepID=UPI001595441A|nr:MULTISPECIES: MerR family transcriptional regulator [Peribacillus]MBD8591648.1 MerR family transcriptional regulator [Peribacillus simplex]MCM3170374.1 helix-turn-helix domain-containing protein [Peribacillus frigoritolerans]MEE3955806.1 MerR family transcriptional regulator [Peribacillus frigoritolerans]
MPETEDIRSENNNENVDDLRLTVKEAAKYVKENPGVIRNWLRELKTYIPTIQGENGYHYFDKSALERLLLVKKLSREQNYTIKQIEYHLATGGKDLKPEPTPEASEIILKELLVIKEKLELQEQFNQVLVKQLEKQQQNMDHQYKKFTESIEKQEEQKLIAQQEVQKNQKEAAAASQKKGFFARLFSS